MKLKWEDVSGKGEEAWGSDFTPYIGPIPPKGSYVVRLKRMTLGHIKKEGPNKGRPRLNILFEVVSGSGANGLDDEKYQYKGAPIWDGLNIIKGSEGRAQGFIHALTDGSDAQKRAIENAFWPPNQDIHAEKEKSRDGMREDTHIKRIGKVKIGSPNGDVLLRIQSKMGKDLDENPRAEVSSYLPYTGPGANTQPKNGADVDDVIADDSEEEYDISVVEDDAGDFVDDGIEDADFVDDEPPF